LKRLTTLGFGILHLCENRYTQETIDYLKKLGYLKASENSDDLKSAIGQFQEANHIKPTGNLDAQTVLLLTGSFLQDVPTLNTPRSL
jgi:hypothetical protein